MNVIGNIIAFLSTFTVVLAVSLIVMQWLLASFSGHELSERQKDITTVISLVIALATIPFYHFPY